MNKQLAAMLCLVGAVLSVAMGAIGHLAGAW